MSTTPTIRRVLILLWSPIAEQLTTTTNEDYTALIAGHPVTVSADALANTQHPALPDLEASDWWKLTDGNTLEPTDAP